MKKIILIICCFFIHFIQAQEISAFYEHICFNSPTTGPYIETHLLFDASTLQFVKNNNNQFDAKIEINLFIRRDDSIVYAEKYELKSPEVPASTDNQFTFMDVKRYALINGIYTISLSLKDMNSKDSVTTFSSKFNVYFPDDKASFSDIQLVSELTPSSRENILTKSGYDIKPYIGNYFPKEIKQFQYYIELYNVSKNIPLGLPFVVYTYIEEAQTGAKIGSMQRMVKEKAGNVNVLINSIDISSLPSGNYNFGIEARDSQNNAFVYRKLFFQRSNPEVMKTSDLLLADEHSFASNIKNDSLLLHYIKALDPIASPAEQTFIRREAKNAELKEKQAFFYRFWYNRNSVEPEVAWGEYKKLYDVVVANFSAPRKPGYQTDRGWVYLKYGPPDQIIDEKFKMAMVSGYDDAGTVIKQQVFYLPYQIWRYNTLGNNQNNRAFVFWSQQSALDDYQLLHSNATGELNDPYWERRLSSDQLSEGEVGAAGMQFQRGY